MTKRTPQRLRSALGLGLLCLLIGGCTTPGTSPDAPQPPRGDVIYQTATLNSLLEGHFEGGAPVDTLLQHGTLGLGTVDRLDGEMVIVDGTAYAVRDDGTADSLDAETTIPFGVVTPFEVDTTFTLDGVDSFADFQTQFDAKLSSLNQPYAFRITGEFDHLRTRSVTAQQPPFPPLKEVIANQTEFTFEDAEGTMVGFRLPDVFDGVNTVGYHAHFLTAGRDGGGHVLEVRSSTLRVQLDRVSSLQVAPREL